MSESTVGPLSGLKVVEFAQVVAGPLAGGYSQIWVQMWFMSNPLYQGIRLD